MPDHGFYAKSNFPFFFFLLTRETKLEYKFLVFLYTWLQLDKQTSNPFLIFYVYYHQ